MKTRFAQVVLVVASLLAPPAASAQGADQAPAGGGTRFLLSARLLAPWILVGGGGDFDGLLGLFIPTSVPRFVLGAQIDKLGIGAGLNYVSLTDTDESDPYYGPAEERTRTDTIFLVGPTFTYELAQSPGGRAQLHVVGSFTFGKSSSETEVDGETDEGPDTTMIGFNVGAMGRGVIADGFAFDAAVGVDYASLKSKAPEGGGDSTNGALQLVGFLGVTFLI